MRRFIVIFLLSVVYINSSLSAIPLDYRNSSIDNFEMKYSLDTNLLQISNIIISAGGDEHINAGDTVYLSLIIHNQDIHSYSDCSILFSIQDPFVQMLDSSEYFEFIASDNEYYFSNAISFIVQPSAPNAHLIEFNVFLNSEVTNFVSSQIFSVNSFDLSIVDSYYTDGTDDELFANEYNIFYLTILNDYHSDVSNVRCELSCADSGVIVLGGTAFLQTIPANSTEMFSFVIQISDIFNERQVVDFLIDIYVDDLFNHREVITYNAWLGEQICFDFDENSTIPNYSCPDSLYGWALDSLNVNSGSFSFSSDSIGANGEAIFQCQVSVPVLSPISFYYSVSSESNYDFLNFYVDNELISRWSGILEWDYFSYNLPAGNVLLSWSYTKDANVNRGDDKAWIDDLCIPNSIEIESELLISPQEIVVNMGLNQLEEYPITFSSLNPIFILFENEILDDFGNQVNWVSINYPTGSVNSSSTKELILTFDSYNKLVGHSYHATLFTTVANGEIFEVPITMNVGDVSTDENELTDYSFDIVCFPNPVETVLHIKLINSEFSMINIELYDLLGRMRQRQNCMDFQQEVDFSGMEKGVYFLRIGMANGVEVLKKVIKL